jgi:hypothetical protein
MSKIKCILFFSLYLVTTGVFANGMGTYIVSAAARSSDPICLEIKDITLLSENLNIRLTPGWSKITVKYILWNNSDKDYIDIDYAFPMDYANSDNPLNSEGTMINNIHFFQDGQSLSYLYSEAKFLENKSISLSSFSLFRRWYYTKISVKKQSFITLEVRYSLENFHMCDGDSPLYINNFSGCTERNLIYDFSPAASWGDGIIRDFYVEVDAVDLYLSGDIPPNYSIKDNYPLMVKGLDFVQQDKRFVYRTRNYDLHKTHTLNITYNTFDFPSIDIIAKHAISNNMYTVTASSGQAKYPLSNLTDMNLETAWVPLKSVGEWIEFTFKKPIHGLAGYTLVNGYQKSEETYYQNNRIKKLKIEIKQPGEEWRDEDWGLEDKVYSLIYFGNLFHNMEYIDFHSAYDEDYPVEKVRFIIEEVYPGTKYNDTCISEIILFKIGEF